MHVTNVNLQSVLEQTTVWVFGYGSLMWKPDFRHDRKEVGYITDYKRRFWQGNETHRGTKQRRGRVATLLPCSKGKVWGVAFQINGKAAINAAMAVLCTREMTLGGYIVTPSTFYPRDIKLPPMHVLLFMATKDNSLYLGRAPVNKMAMEIVRASGTAGTNSDYVTNMADYIRHYIPEDRDKHLHSLDNTIRELSKFIHIDSVLWNKLSSVEETHTSSQHDARPAITTSQYSVEYTRRDNDRHDADPLFVQTFKKVNNVDLFVTIV